MTDWTGTWDYDYDENNRLTSATPPNPVPDQPAGGSYGYDWVGNRLSPPTGANMEYDAADRLISWPGMYSYSYYGDGSLEEVRNAQGALVSSYTYHPTGLLNQATYVTAQGTHTAVNTWDASGNRVGLTINGKVGSFVYDTTAGIPAVIQEVIDGTPVYYFREPGGELIARTDASNGIRYYHFDALGSTRLLTDGDGDITDKYAYDAWGTVVAHDRYEGSIDQPYQYVGQLGYYTHYQDPDFKLLQLGVRFYDMETGRFTQRDAIATNNSRYAYANGNPIEYSDPSGLFLYCHWGWVDIAAPYLPVLPAYSWGYHCHFGDDPSKSKPTPSPMPKPAPVGAACSVAVYMGEQCIKDALTAAIDYERMIRNRAEKIFGNMTCAILSNYLDKPWLPPGPVTKQLNELAMMIWDKCCAGKY